MEARQDMELGRDMGDGWKGWQDETRQAWQWQEWQPEQSKTGGREETEEYKRREEGRQKTAMILDSYFPRSFR
jgi:hypothetical protein